MCRQSRIKYIKGHNHYCTMQLAFTTLILGTPTPNKENNDSPNLKKRFYGGYGRGFGGGWNGGWNGGNWGGWNGGGLGGWNGGYGW